VESRDRAPGAESLSEIVAALNSTWFGASLPPDTQARLAALGRIRREPAGTEILHEGEIADEFGVVLSGRVALRMLVPERGMVTILTVEPGDVVGWSAIVPPHRSTSTAVAIEPIEALMIDGTELRNALRSDHALAATLYPRILQAVSRRLSATRLQLLDLFAREEFGRDSLRAW
jgi:CRP/FNR family transcriptional regulator, cyclic AMP receptor protein